MAAPARRRRPTRGTLVWPALALAACAPPPRDGPVARAESTPATRWTVTADLEVTALTDGVWVHTSWQALADGTRFPSNGLLVRDGDAVLLVDTAWGEGATRDLLAWVGRELRAPVRRAVATHFHDDRVGGAAILAAQGISLFAHPGTVALAASDEPPVLALTPLPALAIGEATTLGPVELFYPGPGHTSDNLVVWVPAARVLFGGCAVRAAGTTSLGNIADADLAAWPTSIERARSRYPAITWTVPGHGPPSSADLLAHTRRLLAAAR